jgi:hypothetical protein
LLFPAAPEPDPLPVKHQSSNGVLPESPYIAHGNEDLVSPPTSTAQTNGKIEEPPMASPIIKSSQSNADDPNLRFDDASQVAILREDSMPSQPFASTNGQSLEVQVAKEPLSELVIKQLEDSIQQRTTAISNRNKLELDRRNYTSRRTQHAAIRSEFLETCTAVHSEIKILRDLDPDTKAKFESMLQSLVMDSNALDSEERELKEMETAVSRQDFKLIKLDTRQIEREKHLIEDESSDEDGSSSDERVDDGDDAVTLSAHSASSVGVFPIERKYYSVLGDMHLAVEHLHNLQAEFMSDKWRRSVLRSTGKEPRLNDQEFLAEYNEQRAELIKEYENARAQAQNLHQLCLSCDIEIGDLVIPFLQVGDSFDLSEPELPPGLATTVPRIPGLLTEEKVKETQNRVSEWVETHDLLNTEELIPELETLDEANLAPEEHLTPVSEDTKVDSMPEQHRNEPVVSLATSRPPSTLAQDNDGSHVREALIRRYSDSHVPFPSVPLSIPMTDGSAYLIGSDRDNERNRAENQGLVLGGGV